MPAPADQIDADVLLELLTVGHGEAAGTPDRVEVFGVHMQHGRTKELHRVGAVTGRSRVARRGGEADLVVEHQADGAGGLVAFELCKVERLDDDALADEGRVAMDADRQRGQAGARAATVGDRAGAARHYRRDELEVARVEAEAQRHLVALRRGDGVGVAEVILHIAAADVVLRILVGEGTEERGGALSHDVDEHIEAAAVGHAHDHILHACVTRLVDDEVQQRHGSVEPLKREPLGADELLVQKVLHLRCSRQPLQHPVPVALRRMTEAALHLLHEPGERLRLLDLHELITDARAVGVAQKLQHLTRRRTALPRDLRRHLTVHLCLCQAECARQQLRRRRSCGRQRVG